MATIEITYNGQTLDGDSHTIEAGGCVAEDFVFDVAVDGSLTVPNYNIEYDGPGIVVKRVCNNVYVTIPDNFSPKHRNFRVTFSHNMFPSKNYTVYITQSGKLYGVQLHYPGTPEPIESLSFDAENLFDQGDPNSQVWEIHVDCDEGLNDFGVEDVEEYIVHPQQGNSVSETLTRIPYDGGLSVVKTGNSLLTITSYGRISMYDNVRYVISVYHKNDRSSRKTISITYKPDTSSGLGFGE